MLINKHKIFEIFEFYFVRLLGSNQNKEEGGGGIGTSMDNGQFTIVHGQLR